MITTKRLLRITDVVEKTGLSRSTIYQRRIKGSFPDAVPLGGGRMAWLSSEVDAWIDQLVSDRDHELRKKRRSEI